LEYVPTVAGVRGKAIVARTVFPEVEVMEKIRILFLAANPATTTQLALDEECREIKKKIRDAEHRDSLELITEWAVRPDDLIQFLNQHKPHIVHFSGHGSLTEEIILRDDRGNPKLVTKEALVALFGTLKRNIRLVLLNACFSRPQAEAITAVIDCAVGMSRGIGDRAAITFATSFYRALGFDCSVQNAFEQGKVALLVEGIPEDRTPELLAAGGVDPDRIFLLHPPGGAPVDLPQ
jgi:CHAT domain-containing protein